MSSSKINLKEDFSLKVCSKSIKAPHDYDFFNQRCKYILIVIKYSK